MLTKLNYRLMPLAAAAALVVTGCVFESDSKRDDTQAQAQSQATPAPAPKPQPPDLSLEVNLAERQVHVHKGGQVIASHPVAVGSDEWPTPTGEWTIGQVIFNPRWTPPKDESWAKDEKVAEPGAPDNPLGVVQLVYSPPNSIHGTNEPSSLGKAVSHGSIRISNEAGVELAKMVMQAGGAGKDDAWVQSALANKTERQEVTIPNPVTIRVVSGK
jgi:lipoprotein-anchoring transpeptidase ErfK/SrfK